LGQSLEVDIPGARDGRAHEVKGFQFGEPLEAFKPCIAHSRGVEVKILQVGQAFEMCQPEVGYPGIIEKAKVTEVAQTLDVRQTRIADMRIPEEKPFEAG